MSSLATILNPAADKKICLDQETYFDALPARSCIRIFQDSSPAAIRSPIICPPKTIVTVSPINNQKRPFCCLSVVRCMPTIHSSPCNTHFSLISWKGGL